MKKRPLALILTLLLVLTGCAAPAAGPSESNEPSKPDEPSKPNEPSHGAAKALSEGGTPVYDGPEIDLASDTRTALLDFSTTLLQGCQEDGKNMLLSPVSVLYALGMTANGASGDTLREMEAVFGTPVPVLNGYLCAYRNILPQEENSKLSIANSIWFRDMDGFTVSDAFLEANAGWYGAALYRAPFDEGTVRDINNWVSGNTDGMIDKILDRLEPETVMALINAVCFDAEWAVIYEDVDIHDGVFTREDGLQDSAELMYSQESLFLEGELCTGVRKPYRNGCSFVALLPNEGVSVDELLQSLTGEELLRILDTPLDIDVRTVLPKLKLDYSVSLKDVLAGMGMPSAFNPNTADFSGIGSMSDGSGLVISDVLHKTHIEVDERGTKAGAVTAVMVDTATAVMEPKPYREVVLDRPFLYLIIDDTAELPLFIGTCMGLEN